MTSFAIASVGFGADVVPAVISEDDVHDIRRPLPRIARTADLFADWDRNLDTLTAFLERGGEPLGTTKDLLSGRGARMLPPVQPVGPVIAAGANFREHIIQMSVAHGLGSEGATPEMLRQEAAAEIDERVRTGDPYIWTGLPSAVSGAHDDVWIPDVGRNVDWELELGVYVGRTAHRVSRADALQHVAGYTIVNDLTVRSLVPRDDMAKIGTDWFRAKNQPGFFPTGPWLVPARFVEAPGDLAMQLRLNGQIMQDATSSDLAFDVPALISYASSVAILQPGDLLITGSPAGNGSHWNRYLTDGDVMEAEIAGLGSQRNLVRGPSGTLPPWQTSR